LGGPIPYSIAHILLPSFTMANYTIEVTTEDGDDFTFTCEPDQYIIDAAEEAGVDISYSCRAGACSTCVSKLVSGTIDQSDQSFLDEDQQAAGFFMSCVAYPTSDVKMIAGVEDLL